MNRSLRLVTNGPALRAPAKWEGQETVRYQLGLPFQLSTTQAAMFCNLRLCGSKVTDYEAGTDLVIFDDLSRIHPEGAVPLSRNEPMKHPATGKPLVLVKYPVMGGFVPLAATLGDGRAHPHAGTGFGVATCVGFPADGSQRCPAAEKDAYWVRELQQYSYDGRRFEVLRTERLATEELLPGWDLVSSGMSNGLLEGEDILYPTVGGLPGTRPGSGLSRWRRTDGAWRPVSFVPVSGPDGSIEPSMIRDADGALLFCVRGSGGMGCPKMGQTVDSVAANDMSMSFLVWRSTDGGKAWAQVLKVPAMCGGTPRSLNRTREGTPFLAANDILDGVASIAMRERLSFWPLTADRKGVGKPDSIFDGQARFGPNPHGARWWIDHPAGAIVRLADGQMHSILAVRICDGAEVGGGAMPTPHTGCWIGEVVQDGLQ